MKILVSGSGAGAQALAWKLLYSPQVEKVFLAPGNPASAREPRMENIPVKASDIEGLAKAAKELAVDFTLITPTQTLAAGVADYFKQHGLPIIAPSQAASKLEWSKIYSKSLMNKYNIPTPQSRLCRTSDEARAFVRSLSFPLVIKADGMVHGGTGVVIVKDQAAFDDAISQLTPSVEAPVLLEQFIDGDEVSYTLLFDGENILPLAESRDYKKLNNADEGPNTGGMGAYSPVLTDDQHKMIMEKLVAPCIAALASEKIDYLGFLYFGVMLDKQGQPLLLEINCRLGNPEIFTILERLKSPLHEIFALALKKRLDLANPIWSDDVAVALQISSAGYPFTDRKGDVITLPVPDADSHIFHSSVVSDGDKLISNGGRVIAISSTGKTFHEARKRLYATASQVRFTGMHYRTDIAEHLE